MAVAEDATDLQIAGIIGFSGDVPNGLKYTPCGNYIIYPLGSVIVLKNAATNKQTFLEGHSSDVSCLAVSNDGRSLASGQRNKQVTPAHVLIWDLVAAKKNCDTRGKAKTLVHRLHQHLGAVQDLDFSYDGEFLATLGGQDDNALVVWEAASGTAICGAPAFDDTGLALRWLNNRNDRLVTAGNYHLRVWQVDASLPKLHAVTAKMGTMRRVITSISVDAADEYAYCGTRTGEVLRFKIDRDPIMSYNDPDKTVPTLRAYSKDRFGRGVLAVHCVRDKAGETMVVVGAGDGTVAMLGGPALALVKGRTAALMGPVTSVALAPAGDGVMVGTAHSNRYFVAFKAWEVELRATGHSAPVNDVCFPASCSDLFITCSSSDIRIWNTALRQELLRIQVPNVDCACVGITANGATIVSGWTDGKVRAFYPESGRLKFVINDAHSEAVTSLAICNDDGKQAWRLVTGGDDGRMRIWNVTSSHQAMIHSLKEHRAPVLGLKVSADGKQCVSASADGSCIVWDMVRYVRLLAFFEPTVFQAVVFHPDESQILTCGSNHKISYWDAYDGQAIRVIDGAEDEMTSLDIEPKAGAAFVSGSADKLVKMWHYDDGIATAVGTGHSGRVTSVKFSPDMKYIVSVGSEGAIFIWDVPK
jgi:WD40 repeat protein